jgi:hypothetical protein
LRNDSDSADDDDYDDNNNTSAELFLQDQTDLCISRKFCHSQPRNMAEAVGQLVPTR